MTTAPAKPPVVRLHSSMSEPGRALSECLGELHGLLVQLADLSAEKLALIRRADADGLQSLATREGVLLDGVCRVEQKRDAILAGIARDLHWPEARGARLSEIAKRLSEPFSSAILARCAGLQEAAEKLQRRNQMAAGVARNLHSRIRTIFDELAQANQETVVYGKSGQHERATTRAWVDALG